MEKNLENCFLKNGKFGKWTTRDLWRQTDNFDNFHDLILLIDPGEEGLARVHLDQDTAKTPHVNAHVVR